MTVHDLFKVFKEMTKEISRNLYIPPEVSERAALLTKTLEGFDAGKFAESFDTIGFSLDTAMGKVDETDNAMSEILQTGRDFGVVMEKFLGNISNELKLINTYGFERGVEGLARMVARGQSLGIEMGTVTSLADKFFDPEGAIDFAAQMQVIGGAVGDLQDPFKLMYMATNDLEGLQEAIADTAAQATYFDKEKNKFSISPESRRQLKAMAEQMGMSYQDLADTAVRSARRAEVFNQIGDFSDMSETDKELVASMAKIGEGGVAQVKIPGIEEMVDVSNVTEEQMELLRKEGMTDSDVYKQQLTVAEKANQYLSAMDAGIRLIVKNDLGLKTSADKQMRTESLTQTIASEMPSLTPAQLEALRKGDLDVVAADILAAGTAGAKNALKELETLHANDAIITKDGITTFDKGDILVAAQAGNVKLGEDLDSSIASRTESLSKTITQNTSTTNNTTTMTPVTLKLEGNIDVNNGEARMNGQDFLKLLQMDRGVALETGKLLNDAMSLGA
jgi:DNA-binding transcriptional regulator YiaG